MPMALSQLPDREFAFMQTERTFRLKFFRNRADTAFDMNNALLASMTKPADGDAGLDGHILTIVEVAHFLRVPKSTVYKLARLGQIPARRIGKHWRFLGKDLQARMQRARMGSKP